MNPSCGQSLLVVGAGILIACGDRASASRAESDSCRRYDGAAAKRTFAGRVGNISVRNGSSRPLTIEAFHPDGNGSVELRWTVPPDSVMDLGAGFGDDWGIRAGGACITTLGQTAQWGGGRFALAWRDTSLVPGDTVDVPQRQLAPR